MRCMIQFSKTKRLFFGCVTENIQVHTTFNKQNQMKFPVASIEFGTSLS